MSVSAEVPRNVRVHAVCPDGVATAMVEAMKADGRAKELVASGGRMLTAEEVARAADEAGLRAFPGQGIVAECLAMSDIKGYRVGGTLHLLQGAPDRFVRAPEHRDILERRLHTRMRLFQLCHPLRHLLDSAAEPGGAGFHRAHALGHQPTQRARLAVLQG